ncbi:hypothetical protein ACET3Z_027418 [Daucus carota]
MDFKTSYHTSGIQTLENLLHKNDVKGAIEFAKKVQTSSRKLRRLSRFLSQIIVQVSSEDEETDWYSVLGADPSADLNTIKKLYVEVVKSIRPTRSREAYRLVTKAWAILSEKNTRNDYDLRRRSRDLQQNALAVTQASSSGSSKKKRKKRASDVERNVSTKKARNVVPSQLHEPDAAVMDHSGHDAAAVEDPKKDGPKTMEVPDSDPRDLDGDHKSQESLAEEKLNAFYATIENDFAYLLD